MLGAFPDYKLTRAVFADALFEEAPALALEVPRFPSPDWVLQRPHLAEEADLWAELVATGHGAEFSNSLVLIAGAGESRSRCGARTGWRRTSRWTDARSFRCARTSDATARLSRS